MSVLDVLTLFGGLAFFLYGMNVLSGGLEKLAGGRLESTLRKVTSSRIMSFTLGAGITIAIQSSSAMTVMLVGLVNSGIIEFEQTIGVILGSNVGTTLTAWILSLMGISGGEFSLINLLSPEYFSPIVAFIGIALLMFAKRDRKKQIGTILVGFAVLMYGMQFMSSSVKTVADDPAFKNLLIAFDNPIAAVLISAVFTGIIQSSAATVGIIQALAMTGAISYKMAIPLVLGANIGTCMTALLSSFGANKNAKRVVAAHIYIKLIGTVFCLILMGAFAIPLSSYLSKSADAVGIAVVHTLFNVLNTLIIFPLKKFVIRLAKLTVKGKDGKKQEFVIIDERLLNTPPLAIEECRRKTEEMAYVVKNALTSAVGLLTKYNEKEAENVCEIENLTDRYEDKLGTFLVQVSSKPLSDFESKEVGRLLHTIGDIERIADHMENICEVAKEIYEKQIEFSEDARKEIAVLASAVGKIVEITVESFAKTDGEEASLVEPLEQVIDGIKDEIRSRHIARVQDLKCTFELGFVFSDLITNYERIADHCSNIAVYTIQLHSSKFDTHKYLNKVKNSQDGEFIKAYEEFGRQFVLPEN